MTTDSDIEDCIVDVSGDDDIYELNKFNVVTHDKSGPNTPWVLQKLKEFREQQENLKREGGNHNCPGKTSENPEVSAIQDTETEIQKQLRILNSRKAFNDKLRLNRPSVFEEQPVALSKQLPVFLGKEYFKFTTTPSDSETCSIDTEITETTDDRSDDNRDNLPTRPTKEHYLNFSHNDINYTFPFETVNS